VIIISDSILINVKKMLGIDASYTAFDQDIIIHTNTALSVLTQLGIGLSTGFQIEDDVATWTDFLGTDKNLNTVKSYVYLRVRLLFDPPTTSYLITALNEQIREFEWRLNVYREEGSWVSPLTPDPEEDSGVTYLVV
jgi:hypothetical protein